MLLYRGSLWYNGVMRNEDNLRRKRINRIKQIIIVSIVILVLIPLIVCGVLSVRVSQLERQLTQIESTLEEVKAMLEEYHLSGQEPVEPAPKADSPEKPIEQDEMNAPEDVAVAAEPEGVRKVYLTFDDGPSKYTMDILDILDTYQVKATFFVLGKEDAASVELLKEIHKRGHTIGMHSYSHVYSEVYASEEAFQEDFRKIYDFLKEDIGVDSFCYRFPGGSSNTISDIDMNVFADYLEQQEITFFDWNISSGDGTSAPITVEQIKENSLKDVEMYDNAVILLHDAAEKKASVDALPLIIEEILAMENTVILPITEVTQPIQHIQR